MTGKKLFLVAFSLVVAIPSAAGYAFVPPSSSGSKAQLHCRPASSLGFASPSTTSFIARSHASSSSTSLSMVDQNVIMGAGIAIAGLAVGIGLVAFTEAQGERAKARGGGLSDTMSTRIAGSLMEDVEVSSVSDLGSLTSQLEAALKESGGEVDTSELTEEEKKRIAEEADDGW